MNIGINSLKNSMLETVKKCGSKNTDNKVSNVEETNVVKSLIEESGNTEKRQTFRFNKDQVQWISYLIDKHGDDFKVCNGMVWCIQGRGKRDPLTSG